MKKFCFSRLSCLLFILLSLVFAGCENFLAGDLIQEQVQKLIEEANAPEVEIYIAADTDTGTVAPNGIVTYKVGKTFPVIFTEGKAYKFSHWEIIDRETKKPIQDAIRIEDDHKSETRITVLTESRNVYLHPVCIEKPVITAFFPEYSASGVPCDSEIEVKFNKSVQSKYINSEYIHIKDIYDRDLTEYFKNPEPVYEAISESLCKSFVLTADYSKIDSFKDFIKLSGDLLDLRLVIDANIKDSDEIELQKEYIYNFRINTTTDTSRPTIDSLVLYKKINDNTITLAKDLYENWSQNEDIYNINHAKSIRFNINASDIGSGVKELFIKETLLLDNNLSTIGSYEIKTIPYESNMDCEYEFVTKSDGLVKLDFFVRDRAKNESLNENNRWTYYIIKDTQFQQPKLKHFSLSHEQYDEGTEPTDINEVKKNKRTVCFYNLEDKSWFNGRTESKDKYSFKFYWGEDKNNLIYSSKDVKYDASLKVPDYDPSKGINKGAYYFVIPEDKIDLKKDTYYAITVVDGIGNEYLCADVVYGAPVINSVSMKNNTTAEIAVLNSNLLTDHELYYVYYERIEKSTGISSGLIHSSNPRNSTSTFSVFSLDINRYEYKFYVSKCTYTGGSGQPTFYNIGSLSEPKGTMDYIVGTDDTILLTPEDLTIDIISAGKSTGNYNVKYTVTQEKASQYDSIEAYYLVSLRGSETKVSLGIFGKGTNVFTTILSHTDLLNDTRDVPGHVYYLKTGNKIKKIGIVAVKGNEKYTIEKNAPDASTFAVDNVAPKFKLNEICSASINSVTYKFAPTDAYVIPPNPNFGYITRPKDEDIIHSGLEKNANGNYFGKCYFIKSKSKWNSYFSVESINDLSVEEIKQSDVYCDFEFSPLDSSVEIPLPQLEVNTRYVLCFQISDTEKNEFCGPVSFYTKKITNEKTELSFEGGTSKNSYKILYPSITDRWGNIKKYACYSNVQYFDVEDNTWKYFKGKVLKNGNTYTVPFFYNDYVGSNYNGYDYGENLYFEPVVSYNAAGISEAISPEYNEKLFLRVSLSEAIACGYDADRTYSHAANDGFTYFEPVYYYNQENCVSGLLNKVNDGFVVLSEQPCLIYTVYSKTNYGESAGNWDLNVSECNHLKTRQLKNFQRYEPDIEHVPGGNYYCVIVHFADGSSQMSEINYKTK